MTEYEKAIKRSMKKPKFSPKYLKALAEEAHNSTLETINVNIDNCDDWYPITDKTPKKDLPLYLGEGYSKLTRELATLRLSGKSIWDDSLQGILEKLISEHDLDERIPLEFDAGRLYVLANIMKSLDMDDSAVRSWANWSPYD